MNSKASGAPTGSVSVLAPIIHSATRRRLVYQLEARAASDQAVEQVRHVLDPNALTLGFARRFTGYKRPTLLLHDSERLARILKDHHRPVQLVVAGKAHPKDG